MNRSESRYFATAARMDEAFLTLLAKKDFEYITVKEICEVAEVNRSTFYLHYETMSDFHYICYRCDSAVCKNATKRNNERCLTTSSLSNKSATNSSSYINEKIRRGCLPKTGRLPGGIRLQAISRSVGRSYIRQPSVRIKGISAGSAQERSY